MLFRSTHVPADHLGARHQGERRKAERRTHPRSGLERRARERRRAALRSTVLAAAAVVLPHQAKPASLDAAWFRPPVPAVTTTIDSAVAVPAAHAYDAFIREASTRYRVDA